MKNLLIVACVAVALSIAACGTSSIADADRPLYGYDTIQVENPHSLADILAREPGVYVEERPFGTVVTIRGKSSPLFIIDDVPVGNSYDSAASILNVNDIASVEVLKSAAETAIYGLRGKNGVIIIRTKS